MTHVEDRREEAVAVQDPQAEEQHPAEEGDRVEQADRLGLRHEGLISVQCVLRNSVLAILL